VKYIIAICALCFPSGSKALKNDCNFRADHCRTELAFKHIQDLEEEILGGKGAYQWYWHHGNVTRKPAQKALTLTVRKDGSAHWE
jgi:hypothetical protein